MTTAESGSLTPRLIEALQEFDTPTLSNAVEQLELRPRTEGYNKVPLQCFSEGPGTVVGYATTVEARTAVPPGDGTGVLKTEEYIDYLAAAPSPMISVLAEIDQPPGLACTFGDIMATYHHALGAAAMVTNGAIRDVEGIRETGMVVLAAAKILSHGYFHLVRAGIPVFVAGLTVRHGDVLAVDDHGILQLPADQLEAVVEHAHAVREEEAKRLEICRSPDFTPEAYKEFYRSLGRGY